MKKYAGELAKSCTMFGPIVGPLQVADDLIVKGRLAGGRTMIGMVSDAHSILGWVLVELKKTPEVK